VSENDEQQASSKRQQRVGVVMSAKAEKTVVVAVERMVRHARYGKTIRRTTRFLVHNEKGAEAGDRVRIIETRPLSKRKRWRVEEILATTGRARAAAPAADV